VLLIVVDQKNASHHGFLVGLVILIAAYEAEQPEKLA
jgi:hypothetical protein